MTASFYDLMRNKFLNWITWSVHVMLPLFRIENQIWTPTS